MGAFKIILLIGFIILIVGGMLFYFYTQELPKQKEVQTNSNVFITIEDINEPDKLLDMNFVIQGLDVSYYKNDSSSSQAAILETLPINHTYNINVIPNNSSDYYLSSKQFTTNSLDNQHVNLMVEKSGEIILSSNTSILINNPLILDVKLMNNLNEYKNIGGCINYGIHTISVSTNFTKIDNPSNYPYYNYCFGTNITLNSENNEILIPIYMKNLGQLDENDYVNIVIFDRDNVNSNLVNFYNGYNLGGLDENFTFGY